MRQYEAIEAFMDGMVTCAVWVGVDYSQDGDRPLDEDYAEGDLTEHAVQVFRGDAERFVTANWDDLCKYAERRRFNPAEGTVWEYAGHDFWLTRNRHGVGFWDRGLDELGQRLTEAAHGYGESDLWPTADHQLDVG